MDVVLLRWPLERQRRDSLATEGRLRLLLVEEEAPAPVSEDLPEDWHSAAPRRSAVSVSSPPYPPSEAFGGTSGAARHGVALRRAVHAAG